MVNFSGSALKKSGLINCFRKKLQKNCHHSDLFKAHSLANDDFLKIFFNKLKNNLIIYYWDQIIHWEMRFLCGRNEILKLAACRCSHDNLSLFA